MKPKKFISIIWGYHRQIFTFPKEQHYHLLPLLAMLEEGYECEVCALDPEVRIEDDPQWDKRIRVFYSKNIWQYLAYLWRNRDAILYANSLTLRSLLVGMIGKRTVFIPQSCPLPEGSFRRSVALFFYRFFTKIRVMNEGEMAVLKKYGISQTVAIPLSISSHFLREPIEENTTLLVLGNLTPIKRPFLFLEALKIVKKQIPDIRLRVIGEDRMKKLSGISFAEKVQELALSENVEMLGFLPSERIPALAKDCAIYLNASISEGQCLAVYETVLMGLFPVLPDILAFQSVFSGKVPLYKSGDANNFAEKILWAFSHQKERIEAVKSVQSYILHDLSSDRILRETKTLFLSL